jgi:DNA-binding transcriptional LysR family regulator
MLAEHGSFVEAANRCGVTQPTLSNGIAALEAELGVRLFARTTRSVRLTEYGQHLLPGITDVLNAQTALVVMARGLTQPEKTLIRAGVSPLVGMEMVNLIVDPFRRLHPNMEIVFRELNLAEMMRQIEIGQLDFVFGPVDVDLELRHDWARVRFFEEPLVFIARRPQNSRATFAAAVTLKQIASELFVMVPDACGLAKVTRAMFRRHRLKLNEYAGSAMSYRVLEEWAHLGIGAAILPLSKISTEAGAEILILKSDDHPVTIGYQVCWRKSAAAAPSIKALGAYLKDVAPAIASGLNAGNISRRRDAGSAGATPRMRSAKVGKN